MPPPPPQPPALLRDQRGIALPLALVGLVAVSLLVTTALVTSSTEVALSAAHQQGVAGLYQAEDALEGYIGLRATASDTATRVTPGVTTYTATGGDVYIISTGLLAEVPLPPSGGSIFRRDVYSLLAAPEGGRGRSVSTLLEVLRQATPVSLNVNAGLTLGVNTNISGNATISNGSDDGAECTLSDAQHAIVHGNDVQVSIDGNAADTVGGVHKADSTSALLMQNLFDGKTPAELAESADIKFGPKWAKDPFSDTSGPANDATLQPYRWGCPSRVIRAAGKSIDTECGAAPDTTYFPLVAVDANGGQVEITGDHGQGTLVVVNGSVRIRGNFMFQGIIISDGKLIVEGTPRIEGAVIAVGSETVINPDDSGTNTGNSVIRFNRCELNNAQSGANDALLNNSAQQFDTPTYSWFEVIR